MASTASAQQAPRDRQTRGMIQTAMEDYQNLEIDRALERLNLALRGCANNACSPAVVARVHMSLGIVQVGGQQDTAAGVASMGRALQADSNAEPDPLLVTSEISAAFRQAQGQSGRSNGGASNASTSSNTSGSSNTGNVSRPPPPSAGSELMHTPAPEQLENTPLPIYVMPAGQLSAEHVYVFFRGTGRTQYQRSEMRAMGGGYGIELPCGEIIQGSIDYYVQAQDSGGSVVAGVGSDASPVHIPIVTTRQHAAPSLPNRAPPATCGEECPPGMSGPSCRGAHGSRGLGDVCSANNECGEGLYCDAGACAEGSGGSTEPSGPSNTSRFSRFTIDIGGGLGLAFLSGRPAYAQQRVLVDSMGVRRGTTCGNYVCYESIEPGFAPTGYLAGAVRYNINRRIGVGVGVRFQFDSAGWTIEPTMPGGATRSNPFANLLLSGRLYYAVTPDGWSPTGVTASVFVGGGVGQIEPKPALPPNVTRPGAHVLSGFGNANVGGRVEYGMRNGFHVGGEVALQFMFPTFLFDIDVTGFVGFHL
ncbi:MAG: hypothetical protein JNK72_06490 [Myxococcales bacterium]|nr:hypothetical protein [Myxococcales bacterium]